MKSRLDDNRPIFQQIRDMVEEDILDGEINEGDKIPSTNELAAFYQINPATAAKGIQELVDKEIIYKRRGIGMFVNDGAKQLLVKDRKTEFMNQFIEPLMHEGKRLGMTLEEIIDHIKEGEVK